MAYESNNLGLRPACLLPYLTLPIVASDVRLFLVGLRVGIQFLLRQAFADDEASTSLLQILLFLLLSTASLMFIPCAIRSSFTLSIHFFGCLPLLLVCIALLPVVCFPPSLLRARTTSAFFF